MLDKNQLAQILVLALANVPTMAIVALGVLHNSSRMSDLRSSLTDRITDLRVFLTDSIRAASERHDANLMRVEQVMDARLTRIEEHLGIRG